ncbi:hypothetical protein PFICI_14632 [Pestalotiopsis fici W106-1]|uniref:GCVT N-terminal domain-containing protein n=1 Tax=Pestalotiopsis fici (strain W106-1 / CGMCC3.15140) TaxID=1229662 RepID=W3WLJ1_PESFW|nr:uncharacterized protein PFICI_14632 [Pestalotiopsis fici W106-1]ETS73686.1 hypothetical protein PFICI_14632 [Pestalotiopsis fici W106-1]
MTSTIPTSEVVPMDFQVSTWRRFITKFEADEFTGWIDESVSWKTDCYIGDWSQLLKTRIRGPEAKSFLEYISTNHWPTFTPGQAKHSIMCEDGGHVVGEGLILMLADDDFVFTSVPGVSWLTYQFTHGRKSFSATIEDVTDQWYLFQVQGPRSVELLDEITGSTVRDIKFMSAKRLSIQGRQFWCLRQGVSGEVGFELWGPAAEGREVYDAIRQLGQRKYGLRQLGCRAKPINHVEAGFVTPALEFLSATEGATAQLEGYREFLRGSKYAFVEKVFSRFAGNYGSQPTDHYRTPFDLGWDRLVKFDHDFIGKSALQKVADAPPNQLVTLVWDKSDVADVFSSMFTPTPFQYMDMPRAPGGVVEGCTVSIDDEIVGCAMSRCYSFWFKSMLSFAIVRRDCAMVGTKVQVLWGGPNSRQKLIRAEIAKCPFKEDKRRQPLL